MCNCHSQEINCIPIQQVEVESEPEHAFFNVCNARQPNKDLHSMLYNSNKVLFIRAGV